MFLQVLTFLSMLTLTSATASVAKPECMDVCGNVSIPYPFGVGEQSCYREAKHELVCNTSFDPPVLYIGDFPVTNISLNGTMTVSLPVSFTCFKKGEFTEASNISTWTAGLSDLYTFSNTRNMFTSIGCDTDATMKDTDGIVFQGGCKSFCGSEGIVVNGSCSGIGCCQTAIPKGLKSFEISLRSFSYHSISGSYNPCSYGFLADSEQFNFSRSDLLDFKGKEPRVNSKLSFPAVLDWVVGTENCNQANKSNLKSYACKNNSQCVDSENGLGYTCNCTVGYEGNPYLDDGCTDIDECKNDPSPCEGICTNTHGSYNCSCPPGTTDDGAKDGVRCIPIPKPPILQMCLGIGLGLLVSICVGCWMYWGLKKRRRLQRKAKLFQENGGSLLQNIISKHGGNKQAASIFTSDQLKQATNNYTEIIGEGGSGKVYKGVLPNNTKTVVAVKKSKIFDNCQKMQFINEFFILSQVSHPNVVKLLGCCLDTEQPALVYEYVSNGNLFQHIHQNKGSNPISWEDRLRIALETAQALTFLHSQPFMPIIHRDVKTSNILLDDQFSVKVADFGISKQVQLDQTQMATRVEGTPGYVDPEYPNTHQMTEKSDVYAFGVVLVELLTGKKPTDRSPEDKSLVEYFTNSLKQDFHCLLQLVEPHIIDEGNPEQLKAYAELAKRCLSGEGEKRPKMEEVAVELDKLRKFEFPERNEKSQSSLSEPQDTYSITSYPGDATGQSSM